MKYRILTLFLISSSMMVGASAQSNDTGPHYVFLSGKISVLLKNEYHVVEEFDGKNLHLDGTKKALRPTAKLPCAMRPVVAISNKYAEINDLKYSFSSKLADLESLWSLNEMNAEQIRFEQGTEFENVNLRSDLGDAVDDGDELRAAQVLGEIGSNVLEVGELDRLSYNQSIDDPEYFGVKNFQDTISGRFEVLPRQDMGNAYMAIVLSFKEINPKKRLQGIRRSVVRIISIGDVQNGVARDMKFSCSFPERDITDAKLDVCLFDGQGDHVATNISRAIKQITPEQLEKFRELEKLESAG